MEILKEGLPFLSLGITIISLSSPIIYLTESMGYLVLSKRHRKVFRILKGFGFEQGAEYFKRFTDQGNQMFVFTELYTGSPLSEIINASDNGLGSFIKVVYYPLSDKILLHGKIDVELYFKDPLQPTEEELELFRMEFSIDYLSYLQK